MTAVAGGERRRLPVVAIIGVGLIGGSLGMAWRRVKGAARVIGVEPDPAGAAAAVELGAVDELRELPEAVAVADVVVVATPVGQIGQVLREVAAAARPGAVVTDTGSTKVQIHQAAAAAGLAPGVIFLGGHPLAGSEASGVRAADPYLFENAFYIITAEEDAPPAAVGRLEELVRRTGAVPHRMTPAAHDRLVAAVSHLPHAVAAALVNAAVRVAGHDAAFLRFAAGGFRDTTRVAGSNPALWRQILLSNSAEVLQALRAFGEELAAVAQALETGDATALESWLGRAQENRRALPHHRRGLLAPVWELVVQVEDRPGAIAAVTRVLAEGQINLREIEILHLREGEGGSLLLGVDSDEALERSLQLLRAAGFTARGRQP
ncbi:MAG: prephenate dehydrogenase/arogenate dehydrogenase family protein [Bacillota bacterium]|nr:prephenate dehydrogenase/arogenate dehydrogenase family protein [Bacillota bacterium]